MVTIYEPAELMIAPDIPFPPEWRLPFHTKALAVAPSGSDLQTELHFRPIPIRSSVAFLRVTVAADVRENKWVEAFLLRSGRVIGVFDIRFAYVFQIHEIALTVSDALAAMHEGVGLRMTKGTAPLWLFAPESDDREDAQSERDLDSAMMPHLMVPQTLTGGPDSSPPRPVDSFGERMNSLASVQMFGWMGGCVLDGLWDLGLIETAERQLRLFLSSDERKLHYEINSRPSDDALYGDEAGLPLAVMAKRWPDHPSLETGVQFWTEYANKQLAKPNARYSAEGCLTVAYPLAAVAAARQDERLAALAAEQLKVRRTILYVNGILYLRGSAEGERSFPDWARGYAWYLLGIVRTHIALSGTGLLPAAVLDELAAQFNEIVRLALRYRQPDGLWSCFLPEPETGVETSGSAGIAAAIALGCNHGLLEQSLLDVPRQTYAALLRFLTPDGLLSGTSQNNKDGETLQRSGYRILSQMGMGLLAQLQAAIRADR